MCDLNYYIKNAVELSSNLFLGYFQITNSTPKASDELH